MDPISVLSNKLQLDLSDSAKVLHYDYNIITGSMGLKVSFRNDDLQYIVNQLDIQPDYTKEMLEVLSNYYLEKYKWWDEEKCNIEYGRLSFIDKEFLGILVTQQECLFISNENGQYYLYFFSR